MIRIYDDNLKVDIEDNCDVEDVIKVMEELDQVYKNRSKQNSKNVTVNRDTLLIAFYAMTDQPGAELERITHEIKGSWSILSQLQKDKLTTQLNTLIEEEKIKDEELITWIKTLEDDVHESDFL